MKTVILCGGKGSRLSEETYRIPKPMVTIGGIPILMHLLRYYNLFGHHDFTLCLGYKQEIIRQYFYDFKLNNDDIRLNLYDDSKEILKYNFYRNLIVDLIDTGQDTLTGGRLLQIKDYIDDDIFMLTYADGLSDVNIKDLIKFHKSHGKIATLTAVRKQGKFGSIQTDDNIITSFKEKPVEDSWINGGFMVINKSIFDYLIDGDFPDTLELLAKDRQLMAYKHTGNWMCMDTIGDKQNLENIWKSDDAFWRL